MEAEISELNGLAGLTAETDREAVAAGAPPVDPNAPPAPVEAPPPSQADQLAAIMLTLGQAGAMRFPSLADVYTEEKCRAKAMAIAPALEKLGWNLNAGETMVFLGAAGATVMLLVETRGAIVRDLKQEAQKRALEGKDKPQPERQAQQTQEKPQVPETPVHDQVRLYGQQAR